MYLLLSFTPINDFGVTSCGDATARRMPNAPRESHGAWETAARGMGAIYGDGRTGVDLS